MAISLDCSVHISLPIESDFVCYAILGLTSQGLVILGGVHPGGHDNTCLSSSDCKSDSSLSGAALMQAIPVTAVSISSGNPPGRLCDRYCEAASINEILSIAAQGRSMYISCKDLEDTILNLRTRS